MASSPVPKDTAETQGAAKPEPRPDATAADPSQAARAGAQGGKQLATIPGGQTAAAAPQAGTPALRPAPPVPPARPGPGPVPRPLPAAQSSAPDFVPRPPARRSRLRLRHVAVAFSFLLFVAAPIGATAWYLWERAADQYASYAGFSVRSESDPSPMELLGSLGAMASNSSSDTEIIYKYMHSHELVALIDSRLDLRSIWSQRPHDPLFNFPGDPGIEALVEHWHRKVRIHDDNGTIDLRVLAFDPVDAQRIAQEILVESQRMVNQINDIAREDALRYAQAEVDRAVEFLKEKRQEVTAFRNANQFVDPSAEIEAQAGVVISLEQQLAEALIQRGVLAANAQPGDQRLQQAQLRIDVIREQIAEERQKIGGGEGEVLSEVVGQYEGLQVDRQFAETRYTAALAAFETARAEALRQSRYLAAYVSPTLAERADYPERVKILAIVSGFVTVLWLIAVLTWYGIRNRR